MLQPVPLPLFHARLMKRLSSCYHPCVARPALTHFLLFGPFPVGQSPFGPCIGFAISLVFLTIRFFGTNCVFGTPTLLSSFSFLSLRSLSCLCFFWRPSQHDCRRSKCLTSIPFVALCDHHRNRWLSPRLGHSKIRIKISRGSRLFFL